MGVRDAGRGGGCEGRLTELGAGFAEEVMLEFRTRGSEGLNQAKKKREQCGRQGRHVQRSRSGTERGEFVGQKGRGGCSTDSEGQDGGVSLKGRSEAWPCGPWCPERTLLLILRAILKSAKGRSRSSASWKGHRASVSSAGRRRAGVAANTPVT